MSRLGQGPWAGLRSLNVAASSQSIAHGSLIPKATMCFTTGSAEDDGEQVNAASRPDNVLMNVASVPCVCAASEAQKARTDGPAGRADQSRVQFSTGQPLSGR